MDGRKGRNIPRVDYKSMEKGNFPMSDTPENTLSAENIQIQKSSVQREPGKLLEKSESAIEFHLVEGRELGTYNDYGYQGGARPKSIETASRLEEDESDEDEEQTQLRKEVRNVKEEKRRLKNEKEKDRIHRELVETRKSIKDLKGLHIKKTPDSESLTIKTLRGMTDL